MFEKMVQRFINKIFNSSSVKSKKILSNVTIQYNNYTIKNIVYNKNEGLYYANCLDGLTLYSLEASTLDLLIQDLIESIEFSNELD